MKKTSRQYAIALYEAVQEAKDKKLEEIILNFVKILRRENKLKWQKKIVSALEKYAREEECVKELEIVSTRKLPRSLLSDIQKKLSTAPKIVLKEILNPSLLGGLIIKSEDKIWDLSLKKQLQLLKTKLISA